MAARNHLNQHQYKLFMTGDEIKGLVSDSVDRRSHEISNTILDPNSFEKVSTGVPTPAETMDELWKSKESESSKLKDTIAKEGVQRHVTIVPEHDGTFTMGQGHHRVAAASALAREGRQVYVPVVYDTDFNYSGDETGDYARSYPHAAKERQP